MMESVYKRGGRPKGHPPLFAYGRGFETIAWRRGDRNASYTTHPRLTRAPATGHTHGGD